MMRSLLHFATFAAFVLTGPAMAQEAAAQPANPPAQKSEAPAKPKVKLPDTLMFTIDEYNDIQGRLSRGGTSEKSEERVVEDATLYLSTIVYYGPQDWTIWINGAPIGPGETFQAFKVTDIAPSYVELLVPLSAQGMRPVRLGPNQTFITRSGVVVEGQQH